MELRYKLNKNRDDSVCGELSLRTNDKIVSSISNSESHESSYIVTSEA